MQGYYAGIRNETRERIMQEQVSTIKWTKRELLVLEAKAYKMVLNGSPPPDLETRCKRRLKQIRRRLAALSYSEVRHLIINLRREIKQKEI